MQAHALDLHFTISETDATAYRTAIGMTGTEIPTGLIMRLLGEEQVLAWLRSLFGARIPIHIKQACEIISPLRAGETYAVTLSCNDSSAKTPVLALVVASPDGQPALILRVTLALIEAGAIPA
ncbi:hypothetical protein [Aestuariivirga litoralis]|uniref:hypothetical protein n=1 Tax=Aestuariivirga litoralis TaxID=2650924 RepID=UPI0018C4DEB8|nr:hypothetical protein [Aestuariivirga litoralis]MBG1232434.1 hypothetical protein [Aestuariivirga litoralis]